MFERTRYGSRLLLLSVVLLTQCSPSEPQVPESRWAAFTRYDDPVSGATVIKLTDDEAHDEVVYQTHPMWVGDMEYLIFYSDRSGARLPHALEIESGLIRPLSTGSTGAVALSATDGRLFMVAGGSIAATDVRKAFEEGAYADTLAPLPVTIEEVVGGLSVSGDGRSLYLGGKLRSDSTWTVVRFHIESRTWEEAIRTPFKVGHIQVNPSRPDIVMLCHETGGDAPQRTWLLDATRSSVEPFYVETFDEWVTHEAWWGPGRAIFTIWPYDDEHAKQPHGILSIDLATRDTTLHARYPAWHTHGSPDGRWILGDDFERNLWLIDAATGARVLWTQGHTTGEFATHPHASFTPDGGGAVFNSSRGGRPDVYLVLLPSSS